MGGNEINQGLPIRCSQDGTAEPLAVSMEQELCQLPYINVAILPFGQARKKQSFLVGLW